MSSKHLIRTKYTLLPRGRDLGSSTMLERK